MVECVVVGGGVIGCATALELARRGLSPLVLEAATIGAGVSGASLAAISRHLVGPPDELPFVIEAAAGWQALAGELRTAVGIDIELDFCGQLRLVENVAGEDVAARLADVEALVEAERSAGLDVAMVSSDEARRLVPLLDADVVAGGSWCPGDAKLNALAACQGLAAAALRRGARVEVARQVLALEPGPPWRLITTQGPIETETVVLATGPWTTFLLEPLAHDLAVALEPRLAHCCVTERLPAIIDPIVASVSVGITDGYTQLHQTRHGEVLFNTVVESGDPRLAGYDLSRRVDPRFLAASASTLVRLFPALGPVRLLRGWAACEAWTADQRFLIGEAVDFDRLFLAAGDSGTGFLRAPLVGRLVAQLVLGERPEADVRPYLPDRFGSSARA